MRLVTIGMMLKCFYCLCHIITSCCVVCLSLGILLRHFSLNLILQAQLNHEEEMNIKQVYKYLELGPEVVKFRKQIQSITS